MAAPGTSSRRRASRGRATTSLSAKAHPCPSPVQWMASVARSLAVAVLNVRGHLRVGSRTRASEIAVGPATRRSGAGRTHASESGGGRRWPSAGGEPRACGLSVLERQGSLHALAQCNWERMDGVGGLLPRGRGGGHLRAASRRLAGCRSPARGARGGEPACEPQAAGGWPEGSEPRAAGGGPAGGWPAGGWPAGGWPAGGEPAGGEPQAAGGGPAGSEPQAAGGGPAGGGPAGGEPQVAGLRAAGLRAASRGRHGEAAGLLAALQDLPLRLLSSPSVPRPRLSITRFSWPCAASSRVPGSPAASAPALRASPPRPSLASDLDPA